MFTAVLFMTTYHQSYHKAIRNDHVCTCLCMHYAYIINLVNIFESKDFLDIIFYIGLYMLKKVLFLFYVKNTR